MSYNYKKDGIAIGNFNSNFIFSFISSCSRRLKDLPFSPPVGSSSSRWIDSLSS